MWRSSLILLVTVLAVSSEKFKVIREWNYLNFTWPSEDVYHSAVSRGLYVKENNIIAGLKYFEDYFYVTLPRMKSGVPATLARIPAGITQDTAPTLTPFPSWDMNQLDDCNALQNVQNIEIDTEGKIWIIDSGRTDTLSSNPIARCPPKLIIFDIKKNMTTAAYTFPDNVASHTSNFLYDIVLDNNDEIYAYITDNSARDPGIIVFSLNDHHSWKIRHSQTMKADPTSTTFRVNDVIINAPINIASIAIGPRIHTSNDRVIVSEDREVFFSPLSSLHMYSVNTSILKNEMNGLNNGEYQGDIRDYGLKASQSVGMGMDNQGILYFSLLATNSISRWDTHTPFLTGQKIIARDARYLEWPNSFTFDLSGNITVLVNKLNKFIFDKLNINEANFRLISSNVGSKGYLYDESVEYNAEEKPSVLSNATDKLPEPEILPGSSIDPFLVPQPIPSHKETLTTTTTTTPEPEPSPEPTTLHEMMDHTEVAQDNMAHDRIDLDHSDHDDTNHDDNLDQGHIDHDHHPVNEQMNHDHMVNDQASVQTTKDTNDNKNNGEVKKEMANQNNTSTTQAPAKQATVTASGSNSLVVTFASLLFASCLFMV